MCARGDRREIDANKQLIWHGSDRDPSCQKPEYIQVNVLGATSKPAGANCTEQGSHNPKIKNEGTVVEVSSAGALKGVHCFVAH